VADSGGTGQPADLPPGFDPEMMEPSGIAVLEHGLPE
jgi:hypothetical protein